MTPPDPKALCLVPPDDEVLRSAAQRVTDVDEQVVPYIYPLKDLMRQLNGQGISATQVGIPFRFFIFLCEKGRHGLVPCIVINPRIAATFGPRIEGEEGCLSFPGRKRMVPRWEKILVGYNSTTGAKRSMTLTGNAARVFQHETDHCDGICIFP